MFIITAYLQSTGQQSVAVVMTPAGRYQWKTKAAAIANARKLKEDYQAHGQLLAVREVKSQGWTPDTVTTITGVSYSRKDQRLSVYTACASMVIEGLDIRKMVTAICGSANDVHDLLGVNIQLIAHRAWQMRLEAIRKSL